ncbi:MAG TPA: type II secretion system F family protein [Tepidisphaeraceae bacterium]|nr:type II secretion system F family protein [Tepidisphaeraceae bacterium]
MAVFTYKAIATGAADDVSGTIAADTPRHARDLLREQGLIVRDLADYKSGQSRSRSFRPARPRRGARRLTTTFIRELATLLGVGAPLLESLETIARQHAGRFQSSIILLRDRVAAGASLAAAMREQPRVFDDLCVNITEVGEDAGTLDASLERLAEFRERTDQLRNRVGTALIYPAIVSTLAVFSSVFLMTFVVPKILQPLIEQDLPLPLPTRIVKAASDFALDWWWVLVLIVGAIGVTVASILRTRGGRRALDRTVLRLPLLGDLVRKQAIVRIAVVLSTLLKSGIVFVRALQIAQRSTGNQILRDALNRCEIAITAGGDIGDAMEQTAAFPPMVVQVFALGQQSGRLEEMLDRLAAAYEQQVNTAAQRLAAILEPALIVALALFVLFIVLATVLPILEVGNAVQ